jgi:hypothetical protein
VTIHDLLALALDHGVIVAGITTDGIAVIRLPTNATKHDRLIAQRLCQRADEIAETLVDDALGELFRVHGETSG